MAYKLLASCVAPPYVSSIFKKNIYKGQDTRKTDPEKKVSSVSCILQKENDESVPVTITGLPGIRYGIIAIARLFNKLEDVKQSSLLRRRTKTM